ncbi:hypothetical protein [Yoonia sp. R2-816]|uniref:hypothetical protein n=2 Tax=unclassified Yoonia TaxID=2629118 RepID=UPI00372C6FC7
MAKRTNRADMAQQLPTYIEEIRTLMETQMWVKGRDLRAQTRRAGRRLPRRIRRDLKFLIDAEKINANPKLGRMVDDKRAARAHANIVAHLKAMNPRAALWTLVLNIAASVALALIVIFVVVLYVLVQRGFV